jgi:hypothetical protein
MLNAIINRLQRFRQSLYDLLPKRADSTLDLLDALSSNTHADSVVKLSLNALFRRGYCSIFDAIENFFLTPVSDVSEEAKAIAQQEEETRHQDLMQLIGEQCPTPTPERPFRLLGLDCTPMPRPYAEKLADRHVVYSPNPTPGNKPIAIGHQYSILACLPDRALPLTPAWILPCEAKRVPIGEKGHEWGMKQLDRWLRHPKLGWGKHLSVVVGDSLYSTLSCQKQAQAHEQLVLISRLRNNRTVFAPPVKATVGAGHPAWYGAKMKLNQPQTHDVPDDCLTFETPTRKGKALTVSIDIWRNRRMRGSRDFRTDQYPFTLLRIQAKLANGRSLSQRPLWLVVFGAQRHLLSPQTIYECYTQRYDLEHYLRFGKQRLLMDRFQTPTLQYEENWWQLTQLAYIQLYLCRELATPLPYPWEKYLPEQRKPVISSPSQTLRNFQKIIEQVGTPAMAPTPRGKSSGRSLGECQTPRPDVPVIYKQASSGQEKTRKKIEGTKTLEFEQLASSAKPKSYSDILIKLQTMVNEIGMTMNEFIEKTALELAT